MRDDEGEDTAPAAAAASLIGAYHKEALAEYRIRLLNGLKRHFHTQHIEGLLSARGLRCALCVCVCACFVT